MCPKWTRSTHPVLFSDSEKTAPSTTAPDGKRKVAESKGLGRRKAELCLHSYPVGHRLPRTDDRPVAQVFGRLVLTAGLRWEARLRRA